MYRCPRDGDATMTSLTFARLAGPAACALFLLLPPPEGLDTPGWYMLGVTAWMAIWWISEAVPIAATALLPIVLFPPLGILPAAEATQSYANHLIYLFMGGFMIAVQAVAGEDTDIDAGSWMLGAGCWILGAGSLDVVIHKD